MLQRSDPSAWLQWLQEHLGPILVAFFVFVLPAIRAAMQAKKQKEDLRQRGEAPPPQPERSTWEDLLQGRGEAAPPARPPPLPEAEPEPDLNEEESLEDQPQAPMVELPSASATESADESQAEDYISARERQEAERQEQAAAAEYAAASPYRAEVAPRPASVVPEAAQPKVAAASAGAAWLFPTEPARDRATALRRAIVLREVLGPPLALR